MKRKRYTEEQIVYAFKQAEIGTTVAELCRTMGVSEATFYNGCSAFVTALLAV